VPLAKHQFDFTKVFTDIGKLFVRGLGLRIRQQVGIDGARYSRPELGTLKARQRMLTGTRSSKGVTKGITLKGKTRKTQAVGEKGVTNVPITRLLVSKDTALRGFKSEAKSNSVRVYVSEASHIKMGKQPTKTYAEIIGFNSRGQDDLNTGIKSPPLVFPTDATEIEMMEKEMDFAHRMFEKEASIQMNKLATLRLKKVLRIG
jgi:hypothetical protein